MCMQYLIFYIFLLPLAVLGFAQILSAFVSMARSKHGVKAPATTGHDQFDLTYRAHQNYLENMVIFLPLYTIAMVILFQIGSRDMLISSLVIGCVWFVAKVLFSFAYIKSWNFKFKIAVSIISTLANIALVGIIFYTLGVTISAPQAQGIQQ